MVKIRRANRSAAQHEERGATFIEAVVGILVFLYLLAVGLDLLRLTYTIFASNYALSTAARWATLGETYSGLNRVQSLKKAVVDSGASLSVKFESDWVKVCPSAKSDCIVESMGGSREFFSIHIEYPFQMVSFAQQEFNLSFSVAARNEPF